MVLLLKWLPSKSDPETNTEARSWYVVFLGVGTWPPRLSTSSIRRTVGALRQAPLRAGSYYMSFPRIAPKAPPQIPREFVFGRSLLRRARPSSYEFARLVTNRLKTLTQVCPDLCCLLFPSQESSGTGRRVRRKPSECCKARRRLCKLRGEI